MTLQLYKSIPNWDEIKAERRKRHRLMNDIDDQVSRKRAKLQEEEKDVPDVIMEDYDDDEDMEKPEEEHTTSNTLSEIEKNVFQKLTPQMAAELVLSSMVKK